MAMARALGEHLELLPHDRRVDADGLGALGEAAVGAGDDVLAADEVGVAHDPLGDQLRVLDAVGRVGDDAGDDDLAVGELDAAPRRGTRARGAGSRLDARRRRR